MVSITALFESCVSSDQCLINTIKHGSALPPCYSPTFLSVKQKEGEYPAMPFWKQNPKLAVNQVAALPSMDLWLRRLPVTDHFAF